MTSGSSTADRLVELGFSHYEARAYVGLLNNPPLTGYALSNLTGIPQPKVYETLRRLARKGVAIALEGEPVRFVAVPPTQLLAQLDTSFRRRLADAEVGLMRESDGAEHALRVLRGLSDWSSIEAKAVGLLDSAARHVYVSVNCDSEAILEALGRADGRGVRSDVLYFGRQPLEIEHGRGVRHASTDGVVYRHHQARHLAIVADGTEVLWALAPGGKDWEAVSASDALLAAAVKGYVRHDIYVQQISRDFGELLEARYGPGLEELIVPSPPAEPAVPAELAKAIAGNTARPRKRSRTKTA